jgi:hypothetical protein
LEESLVLKLSRQNSWLFTFERDCIPSIDPLSHRPNFDQSNSRLGHQGAKTETQNATRIITSVMLVAHCETLPAGLRPPVIFLLTLTGYFYRRFQSSRRARIALILAGGF